MATKKRTSDYTGKQQRNPINAVEQSAPKLAIGAKRDPVIKRSDASKTTSYYNRMARGKATIFPL